jgi:hypothetical protein
MLKNGVDVFVASKRLGHAMPSITFHTLHSVEDWVTNRCDMFFMALSTGGTEFRLPRGAASYDSPKTV